MGMHHSTSGKHEYDVFRMRGGQPCQEGMLQLCGMTGEVLLDGIDPKTEGVDGLRERLGVVTGMDSGEFMLLFGGKELQSGHLLSEYCKDDPVPHSPDTWRIYVLHKGGKSVRRKSDAAAVGAPVDVSSPAGAA
eukprot:TRINITY_DN13841_c0_g1_i2.p1 TRINITY_DN13841_c0_g1~~TRINITY_DN13841_c0_g1_i2.p1  ORF type:complete len:134 (+),score=35.05 TRINITY_DN13841_c0_g1_i2:98-499(+)